MPPEVDPEETKRNQENLRKALGKLGIALDKNGKARSVKPSEGVEKPVPPSLAEKAAKRLREAADEAEVEFKVDDDSGPARPTKPPSSAASPPVPPRPRSWEEGGSLPPPPPPPPPPPLPPPEVDPEPEPSGRKPKEKPLKLPRVPWSPVASDEEPETAPLPKYLRRPKDDPEEKRESPTNRAFGTASGGLGSLAAKILGGTRAGRAAKAAHGAIRGAGAVAKGAARRAGFKSSDGAMKALGGATKVAGVLGGIAAGALEFGKAVKGMTDESIRFGEKLSQVSASMAGVMAERQMREIFRDQRQAENVVGTTRELANSEQNFKDTMEPIESAIVNIKNSILIPIMDTLTEMLAPVKAIAEEINKALGGGAVPETLGDTLKGLADEAEAAKKRGDGLFARFDFERHRP